MLLNPKPKYLILVLFLVIHNRPLIWHCNVRWRPVLGVLKYYNYIQQINCTYCQSSDSFLNLTYLDTSSSNQCRTWKYTEEWHVDTTIDHKLCFVIKLCITLNKVDEGFKLTWGLSSLGFKLIMGSDIRSGIGGSNPTQFGQWTTVKGERCWY